MKFGGTSVADKAARASAAQRIAEAREEGFLPVAVVSAIGRKGAPYATDSLVSELLGVAPDVPASQRDLDLIMVCGEVISAVVFAQTLRSLGLDAVPLTGQQAGLSTDGVYGNARIVAVEPSKILKLLEQGAIPVICGFQGNAEADPDEITTLGRGGTDTTAAAIGAALKACAVEIYTDVDGIKTANPQFIPDAPKLEKASYDEVAELAHSGAKVLHPRAAEIAMRYGIPLWVKNSFSGDSGTEIVSEDVSYGRGITGISHTGQVVYLQFDLAGVEEADRLTIKGSLFRVLAAEGISLYMVNLSSLGVGFGVLREHYTLAERLLDGLVIPLKSTVCDFYVLQVGGLPSSEVRTQTRLLEQGGTLKLVVAERTEGCTMVSVIGRNYFGKPGVFFRILELLHGARIQVFQTGDSDFSVSFLIPESDTKRAVTLLHEGLSTPTGPF
jgi:aspartate kinase